MGAGGGDRSVFPNGHVDQTVSTLYPAMVVFREPRYTNFCEETAQVAATVNLYTQLN